LEKALHRHSGTPDVQQYSRLDEVSNEDEKWILLVDIDGGQDGDDDDGGLRSTVDDEILCDSRVDWASRFNRMVPNASIAGLLKPCCRSNNFPWSRKCGDVPGQ
jgi:hypothetical protein